MSKIYELENSIKVYPSLEYVKVKVTTPVDHEATISLRELDAKIATYVAQIEAWEAEKVLVDKEAKKGLIAT